MYENIRDRLQEIINGVNVEHGIGLCGNVDGDYYSLNPFLSDDGDHNIVKDWEHYSRDEVYPIDHPRYICPKLGYETSKPNLYIGEYGRRRLELAQCIIDKIDEINAQEDRHNDE